MKSQRWSVLIALILLNYLVFSALFRAITLSHRPAPTPTRTPKPTYTPSGDWQIITPTWGPIAAPSTPTPIATQLRESSTPARTPILTPTPQPASTPTFTPTPRIHVVREGENLTWIAQKYGVTLEAILRANDIENPDFIYPGQRLRIP